MKKKSESSRQSAFSELYEIAWPELSSFLLNDLPVNINLVDMDGYVAWGNQRMLNALNLNSLEQFVGKHISRWDMPNEIRWEYCKKVIKSSKEMTIEEVFADAHYLTIRKPILRDNKVMGILGISIDITERKQAEKALKVAKVKAEAANQAKTEFLENMHHDIRTPVAGIIGCAQLIQSQANNAEKVTEFAADLVESSDALLEFLNKVLESIKVASGEIPYLKKKFDLRKVLEQIINLNKSYAISKKLKLNLEYDTSIPVYIIGDPIRVQRIVLELLTNALKFTEKGKVTVIARLRKNEAKAVIVQLSVNDTGIGIPTDKQQEVYARFKRLSPAYEGIYSGTGLGLSVIKTFAEDLGGEISLQSQVNQGSTFTCLLPFQEPLLMDREDVEEILPIKNIGSMNSRQ